MRFNITILQTNTGVLRRVPKPKTSVPSSAFILLAAFCFCFFVEALPAQDLGTVGIIGLGKQGQRHLHELSQFPGVQIRAVDLRIDPQLHDAYRTNGAISIETGHASVIFNDPRVTSVVIATRGDTHYDLVKQALLAGKHVLVEKPFTETTEQARELVAIAQSRNLLLMVGHNRSHLPALKTLSELVNEGALGNILSVEGNYLNPHQNYDSTHTALEGLGYHQLYMIQDLLGIDKPTELVGAYRSPDWEVTVGLRFQYNEIPVSINLSREYRGQKTRNIIVRGDRFTAVFDYSNEPGPVTLRIEPTGPTVDANDAIIAAELERLRARSIFSSEENRPSLHHQLKSFLDDIREGATGGNGRSAINTVETLEHVRRLLDDSTSFTAREITPNSIVVQLAEQIHNRVGTQGGIVSIDGMSGTGKSTLIRQLEILYPLMYPSEAMQVLPMDEWRLPWQQCGIAKKIVLGEDLTPFEEGFAQRAGWTECIFPNQVGTGEEVLWNNEAIGDELRRLNAFNRSTSGDNEVTLIRPAAYIKTGSVSRHEERRYTIRRGTIVIVDYKYANQSQFGDVIDLRVRLTDEPSRRRDRYLAERAQSLSKEELEGLTRYYDLYNFPSWQAYENQTRSAIDVTVDLSSSRLVIRQPVTSITSAQHCVRGMTAVDKAFGLQR